MIFWKHLGKSPCKVSIPESGCNGLKDHYKITFLEAEIGLNTRLGKTPNYLKTKNPHHSSIMQMQSFWLKLVKELQVNFFESRIRLDFFKPKHSKLLLIPVVPTTG